MLGTLEREKTTVIKSLDKVEGPKCQSAHLYSTGFCTVEARYVVVNGCDRSSGLWCVNRFKEFLRTAETRQCRHCKRFLIDCWQVRPL